jgi:hypothetical protein
MTTTAKEKTLTKRELVEGVERLSARLLAADEVQVLNSFTGTFVFECAAPASRALEARGLGGETASAVMDLALAFLASQLTPEKAFRLGTSRKALSHFEIGSREWKIRLRWRAEQACGNVVRFRQKPD